MLASLQTRVKVLVSGFVDKLGDGVSDRVDNGVKDRNDTAGPIVGTASGAIVDFVEAVGDGTSFK